jgi:hypothetical protein
MARPKLIDPSVEKNISIPQSLCTRVELMLFSELEGKVPHGAWKGYIERLIREDLERKVRQTTLAANIRAVHTGDIEHQHSEADRLIIQELEALGYTEAARAFADLDKWYA